MAIVTLGNLLDRAAEFEKRVEAYYASLRDASVDNGVRLLTYYLARHRRHQEQALEEIRPEHRKHIRAIELKHDVPFSPEKAFHFLDAPCESITGEMLLEAAVSYDSQLIALYHHIRAQPLNEDARTVLDSLIKVEERDIVMLKKMMAMHYF